MKKIITLFTCLFVCIVSLSACTPASTEKSIEEHIEFSLQQFGKPLSEAYQDMGLPGDPAKALTAHYLLAEDSTEILGKTFSTYLIHWGEREGQDRLALETNCVGYSAKLDGDLEFAFRLRDALTDTYGVPEAPELDESTLDLAQASVEEIEALPNDGVAYSIWMYEGNEIILRVTADDTVSLDIQLPYTPEPIPLS